MDETGGAPLTDSNFWDAYWAGTSIPATLDLDRPPVRSLAAEIAGRLAPLLKRPSTPPARTLLPADQATGRTEAGDRNRPMLVEIGSAPGRWLAYFSKLGFDVTGIDASSAGSDLTRRNLKALGVGARLIEAGILELDLDGEGLASHFDAVFSLGLVEHFDDPQPVFDAHAALARPGGQVLIGVPNLAGPIGRLQEKLDPAWLARHNAATLRPGRLRDLAGAAGLEIHSIDYCGGFEPELLQWQGRSYLGFAVSRLGRAFRRIPVSGRVNGPWISGTLLVDCRKPA